jgi:hypothetical protein
MNAVEAEPDAGSVLLPPMVYLDTNHLINISRLRAGAISSIAHVDSYRQLDLLIRQGRVAIVFSQAAPLDWVDKRADKQSAERIAAIVDSAQVVYVYENDYCLLVAEAIGQLRILRPDIDWPQLPKLQAYRVGHSVVSVSNQVQRLIPIHWAMLSGNKSYSDENNLPAEYPAVSARDMSAMAIRFRDQNPEIYAERVAGFRYAMARDVRIKDEGGQISFVAWAKTYLGLDKIINSVAPSIDAAGLIAQIGLEACPGINLLFKARKRWVATGREPKDNDVDDWMFLPLAPYCDVMLTDRAHREVILQGDRSLRSRVFAMADEALDAIVMAQGQRPT